MQAAKKKLEEELAAKNKLKEQQAAETDSEDNEEAGLLMIRMSR